MSKGRLKDRARITGHPAMPDLPALPDRNPLTLVRGSSAPCRAKVVNAQSLRFTQKGAPSRMSDIASIGHTNGIHSMNGSPSVGPISRMETSTIHGGTVQRIAEESVRGRDRIEISEHAMLMDRLRQMPEVQMDRVDAVREAIAHGQYETPERLEGVVDALAHDLFG